MKNNKWLNLQLFAGEGAGDGGGEGATTGETNTNTGDADQRLRELGVPDAVLEKRAKRNASNKMPKGVGKAAQVPAQTVEPTEEQAAAAENPTEEKKTDAPSRMSWKEIMADPEYNEQMQATIQARLRSAKGAEEALGKLTPALEVLARQYGLDMVNIDYDALAQKINTDQTFYEDKALQKGEPVEKVMAEDQQERDTERQQRTIQQERNLQHFNKLVQQGEEMKKVFPNFDLRTELQNEAFLRMTAPDVGISVEDAYYAVHRNEIQAASMQVAAQKTAQKISNDIQAGRRRPTENGTSGHAPSVITFDYSKASPEQRAAFKQYLRSEAAQGRKVYPGR